MGKGKNLRILLVALCLCLVFLGVSACGGKGGDSQTKERVTLDMYDTVTLDSGLSGDITWTSSNEQVVTVDGGVLTPVAEGSTEVTAANGKETVKFPVTVEDSGARPAVSKMDDVTLYETTTYNLMEKLSVTYKGTTITDGVTYSFKAVSGNASVSDAGIVTGVKEGIDQINVTATYRGYVTPKKGCNVTVLSVNYVKPKQDKISLSVVKGDVDPMTATLEAEKVVVNAEEIANPTVTATVVSGAEFITLDGLTVTAKAIGTAKIELSSTVNGKTVKGSVVVTVHDDKVAYNAMFLSAVNDKVGKIERVADGDEKGNWLYISKGQYKDGNETVASDYWQRAMIDSANIAQIPQKKYKAFTYKVKLVTAGTFSAYIPSALAGAADHGTIKYEFADGKVTNDMELIEVYDEAGAKIKGTDTAMEAGKWYTMAYDLTTYEEGWAFIGFTMGSVGTAESEKGDQKAYFKDFNWCTTANLLTDGGYDATHEGAFNEPDPDVTTEKDDFINNITFASAGAKMEKVVSGEFKDSYKWMSKVGGYAGRMTFNDVHDGNFKPQKFFTDGMHYISFEVYLKTGTGINVCNWPAATDGDESQKVEGILDSTGTPDSFHVFNKQNIRSNLATGNWYTVVVQVDYVKTPAWVFIWLGLGGSKYTPGVAYIRNFKYTAEMPVEEVFPGESSRYWVDPAGAMLEDVEEGDEKLVKYTGKTGGDYYTNRLFLAEVMDGNAQPQDTYFKSDNQYITFKMKPEKNVQVCFGVGFAYKDYLVDLSAKNSPVRVRNAQGDFITANDAMEEADQSMAYYATLTAGEWYTVVMHVPHDGMITTPVYAAVYFRTNTDPIASFKDLAYAVEDPFNGEVPPEPTEAVRYVIPDGGATVEMGTEEGFTDAVKYTSTSGLWLGRLEFAEVKNGSYAKAGNKWISFKMYCETTNQIVAKLGSADPDGTLLINHKNIMVYNAQNEQVSEMQTGAWYTVVFKWEEPAATWLFIEVNGETTPAVTYFKDLLFSKEWPFADIENPIPDTDEGLEEVADGALVNNGGDGTFYNVTKGEFAGALKYVTTGNWWSGSFAISDIKNNKYIGNKNKFIRFKMYCVTNESVWINGQSQALLSTTGFDVKAYNEAGAEVTALTKEAWYTIVIAYEKADAFYLTFDTDNGAPPVAYFKDAECVQSLDYPELEADLNYETLQSFETTDTVQLQSVVDDKLVPDTFENSGSVSTKHAVKDSAVVFNMTKAKQLFRVKLVKADGSVFTTADFQKYSELRLHVYMELLPGKNISDFLFGTATIATGLGGGAHVITIPTSVLLAELENNAALYSEDGWLAIQVAKAGQKYTVTVDELIGVLAPEGGEPTDPDQGGEGETGGETGEPTNPDQGGESTNPDQGETEGTNGETPQA